MARKIITGYPETIAQLRKRYSRNRKRIEQGKLSEFEPAPKYQYLAVSREPL
jgi:hypothetical protein